MNSSDCDIRLITSIIFVVTYGKKIETLEHEYVTMAEIALEGLNKSSIPGEHWVEFLPFLRFLPTWLPGTRSRRIAEHYLPFVTKMFDQPYAEIKAAVVSIDVSFIAPAGW